jgi:hypothetical protein
MSSADPITPGEVPDGVDPARHLITQRAYDTDDIAQPRPIPFTEATTQNRQTLQNSIATGPERGVGVSVPAAQLGVAAALLAECGARLIRDARLGTLGSDAEQYGQLVLDTASSLRDVLGWDS